MNTYFHGVWRMDWGLGNPNKTAILIAMLMILVWALAYIRKIGFWLALASFVVLGICLIHTVSRGGLLAACIGSGILLWRLPRPWNTQRLFAILAGVILIVVVSICLQTYSRYGLGITSEDPSISNRLYLWQAAPRMMVDAPAGWGIGHSGRAYMEWYQPLDHHEAYRTLVNSHLTWLVEFGWPLRFAYIFAWLSIMALTFPALEKSWAAIPFAIWTTFFIGSLFSSVAECLWLWIIPLGSLLAVLIIRWYYEKWPTAATWLALLGFSVTSIAILFMAGGGAAAHEINASTNQVIVGKGDPRVWVVVDPRIIGPDCGRILRHDLPPYTVGLITSSPLPERLKGDTLIVCGTLKGDELHELNLVMPNFRNIVVVNPTFYPQELTPNNASRIQTVFGELSQSSSIGIWKSALGERITIVSGVGDFIPKWPKVLLSNR